MKWLKSKLPVVMIVAGMLLVLAAALASVADFEWPI